MKRFFESLPIRTKLTLLMFLNSALILGMISICFVINEIYLFRRDMINELTNIARMTALNTASAIAFHDHEHARNNLQSLSVEPNIKAAAIYTAEGERFAQYRHDSNTSTPQYPPRFTPKNMKQRDAPFWDIHIDVQQPILLDGEKIGSVHISSGMQRLWNRIGIYMRIAVALLLIACTIAWMLSSRLQNVFTGPILKLAAMMKTVSLEKDYSIRTGHPPKDETGVLFNGFNEMLTQIQKREQELEMHRLHLEELVDRRTAELNESHAVLRDNVEELKKAKNDAQAANIAKSHFLANVSHELRTPLNAILGFTHITKDHIQNQALNEHLQSIESNGRYLLKLIDDILDMSIIEMNKLKINLAPVDMEFLFSEIKAVFAENARVKKLTFMIENEIPANQKLVLDEVRLRQIIVNLLGNAVKFTERGFVKLTARTRPSTPQGNVDLVITVQDTGIGVPASKIPQIFGAFEQYTGADQAQYGGTGLGLAITKRLSTLMGGDVTAVSEPGKGSIFKVVLKSVATVTASKEKIPSDGGGEADDSAIPLETTASRVEMYFGEIDELPSEILQNLPEITDRLQTRFLPRWRAMNECLIIDQIKPFADDLIEVAQAYGVQPLMNYGESLLDRERQYDIIGIKMILEEFPQLVIQLGQLADYPDE